MVKNLVIAGIISISMGAVATASQSPDQNSNPSEKRSWFTGSPFANVPAPENLQQASYHTAFSKDLRSVRHGVTAKIMEDVESQAVCTRNIGYVLLAASVYNAGASLFWSFNPKKNLSATHGPSLSAKHGLKSIAFFIPANLLQLLYLDQKKLYYCLDNGRKNAISQENDKQE